MTDQRFARRPRICFDTETTGLYWRSGDRVCEIGAVRLDEDFRPVARFHSYVNPQRPMSEDAYRVHGLSDEFLSQAPTFAEIAPDFLAFTQGAELIAHKQGAELIAHNAVFDVGFVNNELSIAGFPSLEENGCTALCTLTLSRMLYPGIRHSLTDLCRYFGVDDSRRVKHGALLDAELLAEVTKKLLTRGA